jgi:GNAT superfamily N-acetyltransferase
VDGWSIAIEDLERGYYSRSPMEKVARRRRGEWLPEGFVPAAEPGPSVPDDPGGRASEWLPEGAGDRADPSHQPWAVEIAMDSNGPNGHGHGHETPLGDWFADEWGSVIRELDGLHRFSPDTIRALKRTASVGVALLRLDAAPTTVTAPMVGDKRDASVLVRPARKGEEERILPAYEWLFDSPGKPPRSWDEQRAVAALAEAVSSRSSSVFLAEEGGKVVGICTAYLELNSVRFGQRCWVEDLAVHPDHRSEGIGGSLLDAAENWARQAGAIHLELDTGVARADAQRFYERRNPETVGFSYSWLL